MEAEEMIQRTDFLQIISNFDFNIYFHKDKKPGGKTRLVEHDGYNSWCTDPTDSYWEFDIELAGYYNFSEYGEFLQKKLDEFKESHDIKYLRQYSRADCYDLLINEKEKLELLKKGFFNQSLMNEVNNYGTLVYTDYNYYNINNSDPDKFCEDDFNINLGVSAYLVKKEEKIVQAINFLNIKLEWLKLSTDELFSEAKKNSIISVMDNKLIWCKSDTDLLELVTALLEMKAINNSQNNLSRKEAIDIFSKIFGIEIKDAESKLSRATVRKKEISPFLKALKESFDNYANKEELK